MHKVIGWFLAAVFAVGVLVLSVSWWTDDFPRPPVYSFTESEMRAAVEGTWKLELVREVEGKPRETRSLTLTVVQSWRKIEPLACNNHRTLVRSAFACEHVTTMPLHVVLFELPLPTRGTLEVIGSDWAMGSLHLSIGSIRVHTQISQEGVLGNVHAEDGYTATLTRVAR